MVRCRLMRHGIGASDSLLSGFLLFPAPSQFSTEPETRLTPDRWSREEFRWKLNAWKVDNHRMTRIMSLDCGHVPVFNIRSIHGLEVGCHWDPTDPTASARVGKGQVPIGEITYKKWRHIFMGMSSGSQDPLNDGSYYDSDASRSLPLSWLSGEPSGVF